MKAIVSLISSRNIQRLLKDFIAFCKLSLFSIQHSRFDLTFNLKEKYFMPHLIKLINVSRRRENVIKMIKKIPWINKFVKFLFSDNN